MIYIRKDIGKDLMTHMIVLDIENCSTCKYWQGNSKFNTWADCYRIVGILQPKLFEFCKNERGFLFNIPFDPHEIRYYDHDSPIHKYLKELEIPVGVRKQVTKYGKNKLVFLQTAKGFKCNYWKEK